MQPTLTLGNACLFQEPWPSPVQRAPCARAQQQTIANRICTCGGHGQHAVQASQYMDSQPSAAPRRRLTDSKPQLRILCTAQQGRYYSGLKTNAVCICVPTVGSLASTSPLPWAGLAEHGRMCSFLARSQVAACAPLPNNGREREYCGLAWVGSSVREKGPSEDSKPRLWRQADATTLRPTRARGNLYAPRNSSRTVASDTGTTMHLYKCCARNDRSPNNIYAGVAHAGHRKVHNCIVGPCFCCTLVLQHIW